jgi:adenylate cyclase
MIAICRPSRRPSPKAALTLLFVVFGIAWGGFLGARHLAAVGSGLDQLENLSLDWRYSLVGPRIPPPGVVIAAIDEETIRQAGSFPLPRNVLAKIVRGLARYNPQVICVDVLCSIPASRIPTGNSPMLCMRPAA